jgi:phosphatidylglycerophosphate synthase
MAVDVEHTRTAEFITTRFEKWFLPRVAARLPGWVLPDHLTALGLLAATAIGVCYLATNRDPAWLWAVNAGIVVHWFADSLDGTLARVRRIQRPRYGFYLDHISDAYATFAVGMGMGLSPYMLLAVSLAIVVAYLVLSINVYLETYTFGEFRYGYGIVGPTEARLVLIGLNITVLAARGLPFNLFGIGMTVFDIAGIVAALGMTGLLAVRVRRNLKTLAAIEPPNVVKDPPPDAGN